MDIEVEPEPDDEVEARDAGWPAMPRWRRAWDERRPWVVAVLVLAITVAVLAVALLRAGSGSTGSGDSIDARAPERVAALLYAHAVLAYQADHKGELPVIGGAGWPDPKAGPLTRGGKPYINGHELPAGNWVVTTTPNVIVPAVVYTNSGSDFSITASDVQVRRAEDKDRQAWFETTTWNRCPVVISGKDVSIGECSTASSESQVSPPAPAQDPRRPGAGAAGREAAPPARRPSARKR